MPRMRIPAVPIRHSRVLIVLEALLVTAAVHGALYFLCGYQAPIAAPAPVQESSVSLLSPELFSEGKWPIFNAWLDLHDPALAVRSDNAHNYVALVPGITPRNYQKLPPPRPIFAENQLALPRFLPIAIHKQIPLEQPRELFPFAAPPPGKPRTHASAFDENGRTLALSLQTPPGEVSARPTVIRLRVAGEGILRRRLLESCGNPALDDAAMQALAGIDAPEFTEVTIYWPETGGRIQEVQP